MHIKQILVLVGLGCVSIGAHAADGTMLEGLRNRFSFEPSDAGYLANKFNFDIFGAASTRGRSGEDKTKLAIGGGVNYFITRNVGVDVHTYADAFETPYNINFSGIYRYPIKG